MPWVPPRSFADSCSQTFFIDGFPRSILRFTSHCTAVINDLCDTDCTLTSLTLLSAGPADQTVAKLQVAVFCEDRSPSSLIGSISQLVDRTDTSSQATPHPPIHPPTKHLIRPARRLWGRFSPCIHSPFDSGFLILSAFTPLLPSSL
jgi:hypothetical protein